MQRPKTYFEQVPLELVEKNATDWLPERSINRPRAGSSGTNAQSTECEHQNSDSSPATGASSQETLTYPEWQGSYKDALLELDGAKLKEKILLSETAISDRLRNTAERPLDRAELQAIQDALAFLRVLKPG